MDLLHDDSFSVEKARKNSAAHEWLKTALLFGLGLYFLALFLSGGLTNYINGSLTWLSGLAIALFLLLGAGSAFFLLRADRAGNAAAPEHLRLSWGALLVIAVPLVLGTLIPSRPLDANAVGGRISTTVGVGSTREAVTIGKPEQDWNVLDWLRAFNNSLDLTEFNGRAANIVGFLYREPSFPENQFMLARFTVACCVADASAIGVPVVWDGAAEIESSTWLRVQGVFELGAFREAEVPILQASAVTVVEQPEHPYLYP